MFTFKIVLLLAVVLIAPLYIPGPDGQPIMSIDDWIPRDLIASMGSAANKLTDTAEDLGDGMTGSKPQIYRWRDEYGALHFSDTPVDGAESVEVSDNALEIPADRFVQDGLAPPREATKTSGGKAYLLKEREFPRSGESKSRSSDHLSDLEGLVDGDLSNAGDLLQNLPALLEQAKQARQLKPEER